MIIRFVHNDKLHTREKILSVCFIEIFMFLIIIYYYIKRMGIAKLGESNEHRISTYILQNKPLEGEREIVGGKKGEQLSPEKTH